MKILIIDDEQPALALLRRALQRVGYLHLATADSVSDALHYIEADETSGTPSFDLILLDIMMPEIDGITLCRLIREKECYRDIPIIMMTAYDDQKHLRGAFAAGATDYITKPFNMEELLARVRVALRLKQEMDARKEREQTLQDLLGKLMHDLTLAKNIQRSVLSAPIENEAIAMHAFYEPSEQLAGDMYSWFPIDGSRYGVIVLDVMGHGVAASLISMAVRALLRGMIVRLSDPIAVMTELNRHMHTLFARSAPQTPYYCTALYVMIDTEQQIIEYVNAGHPPALAITASSIELMQEGCLPLGLTPQLTIQKGHFPYKEETVLLLYTDGLPAAIGSDLSAGIEYIQAACRKSFPKIKEPLLHLLATHQPMSSDKLEDDICFVTVHLQSHK